jgi:hypothetical protein
MAHYSTSSLGQLYHFHRTDKSRRLTVIGQSPAVLELLTSKDQPLLVWGDTLLVLNLGLDIVDRVGRLDLEGDGLAGEGLDLGRQFLIVAKHWGPITHEDLHCASVLVVSVRAVLSETACIVILTARIVILTESD